MMVQVMVGDWKVRLEAANKDALLALRDAGMRGEGNEMDRCLAECNRVQAVLGLAARLAELTGQPEDAQTRPTFGPLDES